MLLSGGLDSSANLALAAEQDQPVLALTVNYGQRAVFAEIRAARKIAEYYGVEHRVIEIPWLGQLGGSALTDSGVDVPKLGANVLDERAVTEKSAKAVWVPNRNGVLINIAAALAEAREAQGVVVGFNREEAATFPDNTETYMNQATEALKFSTANHVQVVCYTVRMDKREIVQTVLNLRKPFPWDLIWSCYHAGEVACGECESCQRLKRALQYRGKK